MKIRIWRTPLAWKWYCPACDRAWKNLHTPGWVSLEVLSPSDRRRVHAFTRTIEAVARHIRWHRGEGLPDIGCVVPMIDGPMRGTTIKIPVEHPALLPRVPVTSADGTRVWLYDAVFTLERTWAYRYSDMVLAPPARRWEG